MVLLGTYLHKTSFTIYCLYRTRFTLLSRLFRKMHPRHYSQIEKAIQCFDKSSTVDFFKGNQNLLFLFKKTERFTAALYILTELLQDSEPIKWELRSLGTILCREILSFRGRDTIFSKENVGDVFATIVRIASLFEIAYIANLVSAMNCNLFRKELDVLASFIENQGRTNQFSRSANFSDDFFRIPKEMLATEFPRKDVSHVTESIANLAGKSPLASGGETEKRLQEQKDIIPKGQQFIKDFVLYEDKKTIRGIGSFSFKKKREERKMAILEVFKAKKVAITKDFSGVIRNCSEKTIQRELLKMVRGGILKKDGEKRWSHYSLMVV